MAAHNEAVLLGKPAGAAPYRPCSISTDRVANPDNVSLFTYFNKKGRILGKLNQVELFWEVLDHSTVHVAHWPGSDLAFQRCVSPRYKATGNVGVNDPINMLLRDLPENAYRTMPAGRHYFVHLPECKLLFYVDSNDRIVEWAYYR